ETLERTRDEKAQMVRALTDRGRAVLNGDDPNVAWMAEATHARITTVGFGAGNDIRASEAALEWPHGTRFLLHAAGTTRRMRTRLIGKHQVYPILAAVAVGLARGYLLDDVVRRLEALPSTPGRLELVL